MAASKAEPTPDLSGAMDAMFTEGMADLEASGALEPTPEPAAESAAASPAADPKGEPAPEPAKADQKADAPKPEPVAAKADAKPDAKAEPEVPAIDPYEGTVPLTLTVDGKPLAIPELLLADGGGLVPPDKLASLTQRLERGVQAEAAMQRLTEEGRQNQHVLSQLSHTVGEDTYQGLAAFEAMKAESAAMIEGTKSLLAFFNDPAFAQNIGYAHQQGDTAAVQALLKQAIDASSGAYRLATATGLRAADRLQLTGPSAAPLAPEEGLSRAIDTLLAHPALKGLEPEDRAAALRQFGPFADTLVKVATTPEEAQKAGVKVGEAYAFFGKMTPWFEDRLAWRKGEAERVANQSKVVDTAVKNTDFNQRVMRNRQPAKVEAKPSAATTQPRAENGRFKDVPKPKPKSSHEAFDDIFNEGMQELNLK